MPAFDHSDIDIVLPGPVDTSLWVRTEKEVIPRVNFAGEPRNESQNDGIIILLVSAFLLFTWVKYNFSRRFVQFVKACFVPRAVNQLFREGNPFNEQLSLVLGLVFVLSSSTLIYLVLRRFGFLPALPFSEIRFIGLIAIANAAFWFLKSQLNMIIGFIFRTQEATRAYLLNNLLFNLITGVYLLFTVPLVLFVESEMLFQVVMLGVVLLLLYKVLRGIWIGFSVSRFPLAYFFLYLIALEIAPILISLKLLMDYIDVLGFAALH